MEALLETSKVFGYGKTVIPKDVRDRLSIKDGDTLLWSIDDAGRIIFSRRRSIVELEREKQLSKYRI